MVIRVGQVVIIPGCNWPVLVSGANPDGSGLGVRLNNQLQPTKHNVPLPAGGVAAVYLYLPGCRERKW